MRLVQWVGLNALGMLGLLAASSQAASQGPAAVDRLMTACSAVIERDIAASNMRIADDYMRQYRLKYWRGQIPLILRDDATTLRWKAKRKNEADGTGYPVEACFAEQIIGTATNSTAQPSRAPASNAVAPTAGASKSGAPAEKLPPARAAKTAPWSPRAIQTEHGVKSEALDPRFAAERADALASCQAPIQQFGSKWALSSVETNMTIENGSLNDRTMKSTPAQLRTHLATFDTMIASGQLSREAAAMGRCLLNRRIAQLEGSPLVAGAVDGTLNPISIGNPDPQWKQQGKDARIIASDGKSAMDCVKLVKLSDKDSIMGMGGRVLSNQCDGPVEITWCYVDSDCYKGVGNAWTVGAGRSWPVSVERELRWAACHGANTASFVKGSYGLRYYCSAPAKK